MLELNVKDINKGTADQTLRLESGKVIAVQMVHEYIVNLSKLTKRPTVFQLEPRPVLYERLTVEEQLRFYQRWYNSPLAIKDLMLQFQLDSERQTYVKRLSLEMAQRISYAHTVMSTQPTVVACNPFIETSTTNIHLFHKMIQQLIQTNRSLLVVTTRTEDAFIVQPNIMTLKPDGLKTILTEQEPESQTETPSKLKVKVDDKTIFVNLADIEYLESNEGKVYIHIDQEKFICDLTLTQAEGEFSVAGFYRCHRSYIVNLKKVKEIITWSKNSYSIVIDNREEVKIPLSRTKFSDIQDFLIHL